MKGIPVIELGNAGEAVRVGTLKLGKGMSDYIATGMTQGLEFRLEGVIRIEKDTPELVSVFIKGVPYENKKNE